MGQMKRLLHKEGEDEERITRISYEPFICKTCTGYGELEPKVTCPECDGMGVIFEDGENW